MLLVVPLGIVGALLGAKLTGLDNNIYLQVGLITTMGLASKNAILIVEFAEERMRAGASCVESAVEGARLRLRPIMMTSLAFVFGVLPLAIASGPGAGSQNAIGRAVVGGTLTATFLAIFFVPLFFVFVKRCFRLDKPAPSAAGTLSRFPPNSQLPLARLAVRARRDECVAMIFKKLALVAAALALAAPIACRNPCPARGAAGRRHPVQVPPAVPRQSAQRGDIPRAFNAPRVELPVRPPRRR